MDIDVLRVQVGEDAMKLTGRSIKELHDMCSPGVGGLVMVGVLCSP